jgi:hypothetical protein
MGREHGGAAGYVTLYQFCVGSLLTANSEHVKRTTQGKLAAATQVQSAQYLKPLFKLLRSRVHPHFAVFKLCRA